MWPVPSASSLPMTLRERRIGRRIEARGERPLFDALLRLRGLDLDGGYRLGSLYAVGGEGAIYEVDGRGDGARLVGKVPLAPWHKPIHLTSRLLRKQRGIIRDEADLLTTAGSPFLPECRGIHTFLNPLLESARGGEFCKAEPCLVMERLGGQDLDSWLCRVHARHTPKADLRRTLDRLAVGTLQALVDLEKRGFLYADLRPGNLRVLGRPARRIRLLDAGGCVPWDADGSRFPHVPSYLPPDLFRDISKGRRPVPSPASMASMAGRTLFEVATGHAPKAGRHLDMVRLLRSPVSPPVAETIAALADGSLRTCAAALDALAKRARRRRAQ